MRLLLAGALLLYANLSGARDIAPAPGGDPVREYLEAIAQAESSGGAYASELVDLYHGMGQSLIELGELDGARDAFHRAAMVSRVNTGPNGLEQSNYLYSIADIEFRVGDRQAAVQALREIYRIHTLSHGEDSPELLPALERLSGWYAGRLAGSAQPAWPSDFQNLCFLAERIAELSEARHGLGHPQTASSRRALAQAHYRAIFQIALTGQSPVPDLVMNADEAGASLDPGRTILTHFLAGEAALKRAAESWRANPDATRLERAEAIAQVGDWNLAFDYHRSAQHKYREAHAMLTEGDDPASVASAYLRQPAPIRFMNTTDPFVRNVEAPAADGSLEISMTVLASGRLEEIRILDPSGGLSEEQSGELRELLENVLFRPAVVDGEVRTLPDYVWKIPPVRPDAATSGGAPASGRNP